MRPTPGGSLDEPRLISRLTARVEDRSKVTWSLPQAIGREAGKRPGGSRHTTLSGLSGCHTCRHMHAHGSSEPLVWVTEVLDRHLGQRSARMSKPI